MPSRLLWEWMDSEVFTEGLVCPSSPMPPPMLSGGLPTASRSDLSGWTWDTEAATAAVRYKLLLQALQWWWECKDWVLHVQEVFPLCSRLHLIPSKLDCRCWEMKVVEGVLPLWCKQCRPLCRRAAGKLVTGGLVLDGQACPCLPLPWSPLMSFSSACPPKRKSEEMLWRKPVCLKSIIPSGGRQLCLHPRSKENMCYGRKWTLKIFLQTVTKHAVVCRHFKSSLTLSHLLFLHCDLECKIHKIKCDEEIIINNGADICCLTGAVWKRRAYLLWNGLSRIRNHCWWSGCWKEL